MLQWPSIADIASDVRTGKTTASKMVSRSLDAISQGKEFQTIIAPVTKRANERADAIDAAVKRGKKVGRLAGVPFIAKDNFLAFGANTTAASNILKNFDAPYQATAIERLEKEGAICVAKANLDAFGHGASTENSDFMVTKNPHDKSRVPGGSSGGPAASVVLGMAPFAIGTDTGGSNRQPASLSGCVGYKPTYGLVSRSGVIAMASSTDTIGPLASTVEDAALVLDVIAGQDPLDSVTIPADPKGYSLSDKFTLRGQKVGVVKQYMEEGVEPEVKEVIRQSIKSLQTAGAQIVEVSLPSLPLSLAVYYIIVPAEISSNLSRYDGQRYGYSHPNAQNLVESYNKSRSTGFGHEAKRRIMIGTYVLSSGYYDAYYKRAQTVRTRLIKEFKTAFGKVDFLVGPTSPTIAFKIGENTKDPLKMYLADIMTAAASLAGIPAISIPAGQSQNMPVGLQIMAPQKADRQLINMAHAVEVAVS